MTYTGHTGEVSAVHRRAGSEPTRQLGTTTARYLATGSLTAGRFGLYQWDMGGPGGATPHFHRTFSESFYILSGTVSLYDGASWADGTAGDFHFVPEGGIHAFRNADPDTPASMLILFAPGAPRERYFDGLAEIITSGRQLSDEEWTEFYADNDQYMV
jgi:mannose-6-phosphate isomerase-like protein (cupin superfamily)